MELMRESWTDKRLDDLNDKVDRGFERIDADLRAHRVETRTEFVALRGEMKSGFDQINGEINGRFDQVNGEINGRFDQVNGEINGRFDQINGRFDQINDRFDALHRLLVQSVVVLLAALVGLHFV
jgi:phage-related tail protein